MDCGAPPIIPVDGHTCRSAASCCTSCRSIRVGLSNLSAGRMMRMEPRSSMTPCNAGSARFLKSQQSQPLAGRSAAEGHPASAVACLLMLSARVLKPLSGSSSTGPYTGLSRCLRRCRSEATACLHAAPESLVLQLRQHDGGEGVAVPRQQVVPQTGAPEGAHERRLRKVRPHLPVPKVGVRVLHWQGHDQAAHDTQDDFRAQDDSERLSVQGLAAGSAINSARHTHTYGFRCCRQDTAGVSVEMHGKLMCQLSAKAAAPACSPGC